MNRREKKRKRTKESLRVKGRGEDCKRTFDLPHLYQTTSLRGSTKASLMHMQADEGFIAVPFEVDGETYSVIRRDTEAEEAISDPYLFDESYSLAASTGFLVWDGCWVLMNYLKKDEVRATIKER